MKVLVQRTEMIGGGTSYDVYVPLSEIACKPTYRIIPSCVQNFEEFGTMTDYFLSADFDSLPACSDIRWNAWKNAESKGKAKELEIAIQAFPELSQFEKLPELWTNYTLPSKVMWIEMEVK